MSAKKGETYRLVFSEDLRRVIMDVNHILTRIEDRLDVLEGRRTEVSTTQTWEQDHVREG